MNKLEKELVFNFIYQTNVKQDKKRIGEKNWRKIITKFFPQTFGIEVEIHEGCFDYDSVILADKVDNYIFSNRKLSDMYREVRHLKVNNNRYRAYSIGIDVNSIEMRSFNTVDTIELLQKCNKKWLSCLSDNNFQSSLHIHIPISTKVYMQPKKSEKKSEKFYLTPKVKDGRFRTGLSPDKRPMHDFLISDKGIKFVKKYINFVGECELKKMIQIELGVENPSTSCSNCIGCDWSTIYYNIDSLERGRITRRKTTEDENVLFGKYYDTYLNMINMLACRNDSYKRLADYIQSHQDDKKYEAYINSRDRLINIQTQFRTFEFRRMTTSNALTIDELLTKVMIVKAMEGFLNKYKTEKHLIEIIEFLKNDLSITI